MSRIQERAKNIAEAEERRRTFILDTGQNYGKMCFTSTVMVSSATLSTGFFASTKFWPSLIVLNFLGNFSLNCS